jgi:hypothetical protein
MAPGGTELTLENPILTRMPCEDTLRKPPTSPGRASLAVTAKQAMCERIVGHCVRIYGDRLSAIVLAGSMARDEATFVCDGKDVKLLGDADCVLIFRKDASLPADSETASLEHTIEEHLAKDGVCGKVGLSAVTPRFLENLPPDITTYELRNCGQVLWGEPDILSIVRNFSARDILREDAWRMLCNRMIEQLAYVGHLDNTCAELTPELHYATVKLFLDMATSYLLFAEQYAPSYRQRSVSLLAFAERTHGDAPFPLKKFAARVAECTSWKLFGEARDCDRRVALWHEGISYLRRLWRWEISQLTGVRGEATIEFLCRQLAKQQTVQQRLRGWLSVVKRSGWLKSWRRWPRWMRLSLDSTPRYLIYRVATEVVFGMPNLPEHEGELLRRDVDWHAVQALLPERAPRSNAPQKPAWHALADDVLWNYSEFLLDTRA